MKHHIAVKFLAIVLCAAALLGAVGSGVGILLLTELNLYNTTVEDFCAERLHSDSIYFANNTLTAYAQRNLGNIPNSALVDDAYFHPYDTFPANSYNYRILDENGEVLTEYDGTILENPVTYTVPASGTYRSLRALEPVEEAEPKLDPDWEMTVTDNVPQGQTVDVYGISLGTEGSSAGMQDTNIIGIIHHQEDGTVHFMATAYVFLVEDMGLEEGETLTSVGFYGPYGEVIYEATCPGGVGTFVASDDGSFTFTSFAASMGTASNTFVYNYLPQDKDVLVASIEVGWDGGSANMEYAELGYLRRYEDNTVGFSATSFDSFGEEVENPVTYICFQDGDGDILFLASNPEGVGTFFYNSRGGYCFRSTVAQAGTVQTGTVNAYVNVYESPGLDASVTGALGLGAPVDISQIRTVDGVQWGLAEGMGWVLMDQVTLAAEPAANSLEEETAQETSAVEEMVSPTVAEETVFPETTEDTTPTIAPTEEPTVPATLAEEPPAPETGEKLHTYDYWDSETQQRMQVTYANVSMPAYTLELQLEEDLTTYFSYYPALELLWNLRNNLYIFLIGGLLLFAVLAVYLCCAAGRKPGSEEIHPAGFNVLPLDLYLLAGGCGIVGLLLLVDWASYDLMGKNWETCVGFGLCAGYVACLIFVGFCYACAAQLKVPGGCWWRNTLCVRLPVACWKLCRWMLGLFPWLGRVLRWCWHLVVRVWSWAWGLVKNLFRWCYRKLNQFLKLLPLTWQWLLAGGAMVLLLLMAQVSRNNFLTWLCLVGTVGIVLYGAHCFGILAESTRRMSKGDLNIQVEDPWMLGAFQDFAQDLNGLAGVAVVAAQKQLKSERMKTELITNVSHDIKTPLTSIINYVDLLQKPHTEEEGKQYLEVLDRQSQRLKKLIEDLMEMSKANTGNMTVDIKPLDAVETVNQALGEFADKLEKAQLMPVFRRPEEPVTMLADGRLAWRVLSNILGNAVKYALPGTRLYIDLMVLEGKVVLSVKNISREELNVEADELMERFVRGDSSRNTEGSGLGLNIAKSLMELQKGSLQLLVDGDLFKVTLIFPAG